MSLTHKNQVERFVDRCFVRHAKRILFIFNNDSKDNDQIGFIHYSDDKCDWKVEIYQTFLIIKSRYFSGKIAYEDIKNSEVVCITQQNEAINHVKIYEVTDYIRALTDEEIKQHKNSQNGIFIDFGSMRAHILLCADDIEKVSEIAGNLCDFLRRVRLTKAWEDAG